MTVLICYLFFLLIQNVLLKKDRSVLLCGLFGVSLVKNTTSEQARVALQKMKLLGLLSFPGRGRDACGIYLNGEIIKSSKEGKDTSEFSNFLMNPQFVWPQLDLSRGNVMIGHVRQASYGVAKTTANTHPFYIQAEKREDDIVLVHNGTIDNIWTLCSDYELDHVGEHINSDSLALGTLMVRNGTEVLEKYTGAAALIWTKPNSEPNTLYVFHGASYKYRYDKTLTEERPLYYMHTEEGCYFASEERFLNAIRESSEDKVEWLKMNSVLKITNGVFGKKMVEINRENANLSTFSTTSYYPSTDEFPGNTMVNRNFHNKTYENTNLIKNSKVLSLSPVVEDPLATPKTNIVWDEPVPKETLAHSGKSYVSFYKGRYHLSTGNYPYGNYDIKEKGIICETPEQGSKEYWFFEGVLLRSKEDYDAINKEAALPNNWVSNVKSNFAYYMSRYSMYPCCNLPNECIEEDAIFKYSWYFREERALNHTLTPYFSGKSYIIKNGFLVKITDSNSNQSFKTSTKFSNNDSHFDVVFSNTTDCLEALTDSENKALIEFVKDSLKENGQDATSDFDVQSEIWTRIKKGITLHKTIREIFLDKIHALDGWVEIINEENERLNAISEKEDEEAESAIDGMDEQTYFELYGYISDQNSPFKKKIKDEESLVDAHDENEVNIDTILKSHQTKLEEVRKNTIEKIEELVTNIEECETITCELNDIKFSPYAETVSRKTKIEIRNLKSEIKKTAEFYNDSETINRINQTVE